MFRSRDDLLLVWVLRGVSFAAGGLILLILFFLFWEAMPALRALGPVRFFRDPSWHPTEGLYNMTPMLLGSLFVTFGALLLVTPIGLLSAVFCHFYAPEVLGGLYRRVIELLAGIPSVVYGLWGLVVLVPLIRQIEPPGMSLLAGILILTIMILPTMALTAYASFAGVPEKYIQGAAALGLSRWGTLRGVVLPAAMPGLFTGVILSTGRAVGETMAVLMVCGNVVQTPDGLFDPVRTLTANIALEMAYAMGNHRSALFVSGVLLLVIVAGLVSATHSVSERRGVHGVRPAA